MLKCSVVVILLILRTKKEGKEHAYFSANRFCSYFSATEKNSSISACDGGFFGVGGVFFSGDSISSESPQSLLNGVVSLLKKRRRKMESKREFF